MLGAVAAARSDLVTGLLQVAITQQPSAGPHQLAKFPGTVKLATVPAVKVTDFNGYAVRARVLRTRLRR